MKRILSLALILIAALTLISCKNSSSREDDSRDQVEKHFCTYEYDIKIISPTCESGGYTIATCTCGATQTRNETAPLGHSWLAWQITETPTMESMGSAKRICENGHEKNIVLPAINLYDYDITSLNGYESYHCITPTTVRCIYEPPLCDDSDTKQFIEFNSEYLLNHSYSKSYVYSDTKHYSVCSFCSNVDENSGEDHNLSHGICTVCGYVDPGITYSSERYGLAASYDRNEPAVSIPEFYTDHYVPNDENKIKGIKSFANNTNLCSITIPSTIEYVEDFDFEGFDYIAALTIPKSVTELEPGSESIFGYQLRVGKIYYGDTLAERENVFAFTNDELRAATLVL